MTLACSLSTDIVCKCGLLAKAPRDKAVCCNGMPQGTITSYSCINHYAFLPLLKKHLQFIGVQVPFATCFDAAGMNRKLRAAVFREGVSEGYLTAIVYECVCCISIICLSSQSALFRGPKSAIPTFLQSHVLSKQSQSLKIYVCLQVN